MSHPRWRRQLSLALAAAGLSGLTVLPTAAQAASGMCALPRIVGSGVGVMPASATKPAGVGAYRNLVIPIDFSDLPGTSAVFTSVQNSASLSTSTLTRLSEGDLSFASDITVSSWIRMPQPRTAYNTQALQTKALELVRSSLPGGSFAPYRTITYVLPDGVSTSAAYSVAAPDGTTFAGGVMFNGTSSGGSSLAHELLHHLDLPDLYTSSSSPTRMYDIMSSLNVPTDWLLTYQQYKLGWLPDSQVSCVSTTAPVSATLTPIENVSSTALKSVIVPLDTRRALVVEARKSYLAVLPADCMAGVVISVIDTGTYSGAGPIQVKAPSQSGGPNCSFWPGGRASWTSGTYTDASGTTVAIGTKDAAGNWPVTVTPATSYASVVRATAGLQANWRLGERFPLGGDSAATNKGYIFNAQGDASRSGRDSALMGAAASYDQPGALFGQADTAQSFDGTRQIDVPDVVNSTTYSAEAWTKLTASGSTFLGVLGGGGGRLRLEINGTQARAFAWRGTQPAAAVVNTPNNLNTWVHWVVTSDGTTLRLYSNGRLRGSGPITGTGPTVLGGSIGSSGVSTTPRFQGLIDEVSYYNTALTAAQITQRYNLGKTGTP